MKWLLGLLVAAVIASSASAAPQAYRFLEEGSSVGFSWFLGSDEIKGHMPVTDADITIDFQRLRNSQVNVTLDVASANAGFPFASQGMKGPKVLWADEFPEIFFESTNVSQDGIGARIEGDLTLRGVTLPVVLSAKLFRPVGTEQGDRRNLFVRMTGSVSRSAFGADGWANLAGDEVILRITAHIELIE